MLFKSYQMVFLSTLMMGTMIAVSASNWFTCWLGLEINLISMIPLLLIKLTPLSTESAIKYFLAQAMASLILIFASLSESILMYANFMEVSNSAIFMTLLVKAGIPPFHFWFPQVMKASEWAQCILIITWQKIAPLVLMTYTMSSKIMILAVLSSVAIGSLGGLNQTNMKTILTYSSISHSAWMLAVLYQASPVWVFYFAIYSVISASLIFVVTKLSLSSLSQLNSIKVSKINKTTLVSLVMSLGGLPPLLGFLPKLTAIQTLMSMKMQVLPLALIMASLVSLFYYIRMVYSSMLMKFPEMNYVDCSNPPKMHTIAAVTLSGNLVAPILVCML